MTTEHDSGAVIRVFGPIAVHTADGPVSIGGSRQRRLLALLAIRPGAVVDIDWLAEHLWTDDERPAATGPAVRTYLSRLRHALPVDARDWIQTVPSGYTLAAPASAVEHQRFAQLRAAATEARDRDDPLTAHTKLDEALGLWRGEPFGELEDLDIGRSEVEQLRLDRLEMMEERWEAALALGRHTQITGELAVFTNEHGHRDRAVRQHALALYRSGRTADALRVIADYRTRLADETGLDPSADTIDLEQAMLADDPGLSVEKVGRPLRGYRLLEQAGSGAFSVVWRGEQPSVQREVAIKQIRAELASRPEFIRRFEAEAHLVARLEHPHIVPLIDYWRDPDSAYLVMRWLRGGTLEQRLERGPLTVDESVQLAREVGGALTTAHDAGVVHRDVKTANILFDEQQHAFLADFGIALATSEPSGSHEPLSPGSPVYAAPEQLRREPVGPAADVFSLGVVIFECLTGTVPFPSNSSVDELIDRQLTIDFPRITELRPDVPTAISDAVAKATAKDAGVRFASIAEFVAALDRASDGAEIQPSTIPADLPNPYVGLRAFDDSDADRFHGRNRLVAQILARLDGDGARCVVVVGPSGSGKSSVVRAGVVPALRAGAATGSSDWFTTTMVPGDDPYGALEAALLRVAVDPPPSLGDQLGNGPRGVVQGVRRCLAATDGQLLLVLDQMEELFVGPAADDADQFLDALTIAVTDPSSPLRVVATLRADFYDRPLQHAAFAPILASGAVDVTPLTTDEIERAIVEPAARNGIGFERGLVARIAIEAARQPSPLPLLQYTLSELFDRRAAGADVLSIADYDELGGLSGALVARSESLHQAASADERAAIRSVFGRLTDATGDTADLRRRVSVADLGRGPATEWVVERFTTARLLTLDRDPTTREPTVEIAHEALLREWPRLGTWLAEDRDLLRTTDAVARAATTWDEGGRTEADLSRGARLAAAIDLARDEPDRLRPIDGEFIEVSRAAAEAEHTAERRRIRRLRRLVAAVAAALVVALVAGAFAWDQQRRADDEADAARTAAAEAELATLVSRSASLQDEDRPLSLLLALEAHRRSPGSATELAVLDALSAGTEASISPSVALDVTNVSECAVPPQISDDGTQIFQVIDSRMIRTDLTSEAVTDHGSVPTPFPDGCGQWFADDALRQRVVGTSTWVFDSFEGDSPVSLDVEAFTIPANSSIVGNRVVFAEPEPGPTRLVVRDATTGELIAAIEGDDPASVALASDGSLVSVARGTPSGGEVIVLDAETGIESFRIEAPRVGSRFSTAFDPATNEMLLVTAGGDLVTIDTAAGAVVAQVPTTSTSELLAVGVRPDGLVVMASEGQIELVDRNEGPTGAVVPVRNAVAMKVRADGSVLKIEPDGRTEIIQLGGSGIAEQTWNIDDFALVNMADGRAAWVDESTGDIELIELSTGERFTIALLDPDGTRPPIAAVDPRADGLLTFTRDGAVVARWDDAGNLIEQVSTGSQDGFVGGGGFFDDDRGANIIVRDDGSTEVASVAVTPELSVLMHIDAPDVASAIPAPDDGVYVIDLFGVFRTYDASGEVIDEFDLGVADLRVSDTGEFGDRIALAGSRGGVIVDPTSRSVERFPTSGTPSSLDFVNDDSLLLISGNDGTISVWDVERGESGGVIWRGSGATDQGGSYYDEETRSVWIASSGELVRLPTQPARWIELACEEAGRDFTAEEWDRLVPGDDPLRSAC